MYSRFTTHPLSAWLGQVLYGRQAAFGRLCHFCGVRFVNNCLCGWLQSLLWLAEKVQAEVAGLVFIVQ